MIVFGCIAAISLAVFGKFGMDLVGIAKERKRRTNWTCDYDINKPTDQAPEK